MPLAVAAIIVGSARAQEAAITFIAPPPGGAAGAGVAGWQFTTRMDISISALGLYDAAGIYGGGFVGDGLLEEHAVGIWDISNHSTPLLSALIPAGTLAPLANGFRYVSTSPVVLPSNHDYVIAALFSDAAQKDFGVGGPNDPTYATVSPQIEFGGYRFEGLSVLAFPEYYEPGEWWGFGPNFTYTVVPEPSTLGLCALAAAVLFGSRNTLRLRTAPVRPSPEISV